MKKVIQFIVGASAFILLRSPASAAGVPDAGSMMTVAYVAGLVLLIFVINAVFGAWVYKDSKQRGMQNPTGWIVAAVIFGAPAVIGYMIARPKEPSKTPQD